MDAHIASKLDAFFGKYPSRHLSNGSTLIQGHDDPPGVIRLDSGLVTQYDISPEGQKLIVNTFRPGAFFPMSWAINKAPNSYFFEAADDCEFRVAPPEEVLEFLQGNPDVLLDLLGRVYRGTDGMQKRMALLMAGNVRARLLLEVVITCRRFGRQRDDGSYVVEITESNLAARTGLSRETVSRHLQRLKDEKLLQNQRGRLIITDLSALDQALEVTS